MAAPGARLPVVLGHRGAGGLAPENTMEAFEWAVENGIDGIELDVHVSKDSQVVIVHDDKVEWTEGKQKKVTSLTAIELRKKCNAPLLEEVLLLCLRGGLKHIVVELKGANTALPTAKVFEKVAQTLGSREQVIGAVRVSGFDWDRVDRFRWIKGWEDVPRCYTSSWFTEELFQRAVEEGASDLHLHESQCSKELITRLHDNKIKLMIWLSGVQPESLQDQARLFELGADFYCLNNPRRLSDAGEYHRIPVSAREEFLELHHS